MERWTKIVGLEQFGEVSTLGRIRLYERKYSNSGRIIPERMAKTFLNRKGYCFINLLEKTYLVHRLVAKAFIPNPENKPQINHKDLDKQNNRVENLEWATNNENRQHAVVNGRVWRCQGEVNPLAKLSNKVVLLIAASKKPGTELAKRYNISPTTICDIKNGKTWTHITGAKRVMKTDIPDETVLSIFKDKSSSYNAAKKYGVSASYVRSIRNGSRRSDITGKH